MARHDAPIVERLWEHRVVGEARQPAEDLVRTVLCAGENLDPAKHDRLVTLTQNQLAGAVVSEVKRIINADSVSSSNLLKIITLTTKRLGTAELVEAVQVLMEIFFTLGEGFPTLRPGTLTRIKEPDSLLVVRRVQRALEITKVEQARYKKNQ